MKDVEESGRCSVLHGRLVTVFRLVFSLELGKNIKGYGQQQYAHGNITVRAM
jgi:hypothetical protein